MFVLYRYPIEEAKFIKQYLSKAVLQKAPLHVQDTESQTFGCRHSNPGFCGFNSMMKACAFVREDHICKRPPRSWKKLYTKLKREQNKV